MLRKSTNRNNYLNDNLCHIRVNKRSNDERNSPRLSHQANNYFYNTKINRLILQEIPNNNVHNVYQEYQENKNISTDYDILHRNTSYLNKSKNDIYQLDITRIIQAPKTSVKKSGSLKITTERIKVKTTTK